MQTAILQIINVSSRFSIFLLFSSSPFFLLSLSLSFISNFFYLSIYIYVYTLSLSFFSTTTFDAPDYTAGRGVIIDLNEQQ